MALFNTDRLSKSERQKLRELRRGQKAKGFKKKSHAGLTAAESIEKRKLEGKRRQARMDDFGKGVVGAAVGGLGAALGGGAALGKLAGKVGSKVGSKLGGEAGKKALIDAGKKKLQDFTKKAIARKAGDIASSVNTGQLPQANPRATEDTRVEGLMNRLQGMDGPLELEDIPLEEESFPEDETFGQMKGLSTDAIRKLSPSASNINKLTRLMQQKKDQGRSELDAVGELDNVTTGGMGMEAILQDLSKRNMPSIQAGPIFNQVTGGRKRKTSNDEELQYRMDEFMKRLGGFNQSRGLAGLGNTFRTGGRIKVKKKY